MGGCVCDLFMGQFEICFLVCLGFIHSCCACLGFVFDMWVCLGLVTDCFDIAELFRILS